MAKQKHPTLTMKYAGGLIKHLGLQMYSGAVSSIAELIKNSYDANAKRVNITIPFDHPWDENSIIVVEDDGHGMTFEDLDKKYLVVGRDRRKLEGDRVEGNPNRRPIGRKGIGKLAGFGIAEIVQVRSVKQGKSSIFEMNYADIERLPLGKPYRPKVIEADRKTVEPNGTTVQLRRIKLQRPISEEDFRYSMAKRFALLNDGFIVEVNGNRLNRDEIELQFRFPPITTLSKGEQLATEYVEGCGTIKWWIGFTKKPIRRDEDRGIVVLVRGTTAQLTPFFFGLTGGTGAQLGLQYITGEVYADLLDQETIDAIATDRGSINWEKPEARPLQEWGKSKIKELLEEWGEARRKANEEHLSRHTKYIEKVKRFPDRQREELTKAITKIASIPTIEDDRLDELVEFLIEAYERADIMTLIRQLMAASPMERAKVFEILAEWDVVEAISFAQVIKGRLAIIKTFEDLLASGAPEKVTDRDDMQGFLAKYPWLIDVTLTLMDHEKTLDTVLAKHFKLDPTGEQEGKKRIDFFCLRVCLKSLYLSCARRFVIKEIMAMKIHASPVSHNAS